MRTVEAKNSKREAPKLARLLDQIRAGDIDTVITAFPDMQGRWMGKRVAGPFFADTVARDGVHACNYLLTVDVDMEPVQGYEFASWKTGYGDFHLAPDASTIRTLPWLEKTALIVCDLENEDGSPVEVSPRRILKRQLERAAKLGYTVKTASELEFYLFRETYESARRKHYHELEPFGHYIEDYHILQGTKEEFVIREIRNQMEKADVPIESSKGEWGFGQHEINFRYAEALEMADRHTVYKTGAKEIALLRGHAITFMAKYRTDQAGSSMHLHSSLWDLQGKKAAFWSGDGPSETFQHYLGGQLALAREFAYFYAPYVNSYKRYMSGTFAPTRIAWGRDNRTCGFRLVGHGSSFRVENRVPGADANPYLAFAATIAAGLYGIENKIKPPKESSGNVYESTAPEVPKSLPEAIEALKGSRAAREALGEEVFKHYLHTAEMELAAYNKNVTCWELARNFERI
jgi:glutamine synthetase